MNVERRRLGRRQWWKAAAVGLGTGLILAGLNVVALKTHVSPLPKPLALAFADTITGIHLPLPVGLLFHLAWVTFFSVVYVVLFRNALTLKHAFWLAAALWLVTVVIFFPIVGWGVFGLAASPRLIAPVTVSHILFALILWGLCRAAFGEGAASKPAPIACTLTPGELQERIAGIADLNRCALRAQRRDGLRLELTYAPAARDRVRAIVARERKCCAFLTFALREEKDAIRLVIEAPEAARDIADAVFEPFQARATRSSAPSRTGPTASACRCTGM